MIEIRITVTTALGHAWHGIWEELDAHSSLEAVIQANRDTIANVAAFDMDCEDGISRIFRAEHVVQVDVETRVAPEERSTP